jgi:hypothetical protein
MPLPDDVQVVSVDDHVIEHPGVWQERLPARLKERGPRIVRTVEGHDVWEFEGGSYPNVGLNAVAGREREDFGVEPMAYTDMRPGCYQPAERIADMDLEGVYAQLSFPTFPGFAGSTFAKASDKALAAECVRAWNDWAIDEWCGAMPGRQIPVAIVPYWDIDATVREAERVIGKGARTISVTEAPLTTFIALFGLNSQMATIDLCNSRMFERFPKLKFALSEGGIGWLPYILERTDYTWERHRYYTGMSDARKPSEIFRDHIYGCFIYDEAGLANIDRIGVDNVMFESDYPHSDSNWPHTRKMLAEALAGVPDDVARRLAEDNARLLYRFPRTESSSNA